MNRPNAVTFKGTPMTLAGEEVKVGQAAPDFTLHFFEGGLKTLTLADLRGKPTLLSVVPSLDTGVCAMQTKKFNEQLAELGHEINAVTVSLDLPFAQGRFCTENKITNMRSVSDYNNRNFGKSWGLLIEELKLLSSQRLCAGSTRQNRACGTRPRSHARAELRCRPQGAQRTAGNDVSWAGCPC